MAKTGKTDQKQMDFYFDNSPGKMKKKTSPKKKTKKKGKKASSKKGGSKSKKTTRKKRKKRKTSTAETMASKQRSISISEFFAKNRHLLGFDNPSRSLMTAVKEAVDNALDACEEGEILPYLEISLKEVGENKYSLTVKDNGPGIVKKQVPNIFAKLLYGSKFHSLKMSRGQQGIGISAAGMYGLLTTGQPVEIISKTSKNKPAYHCHVQIDTAKNKPEIVTEKECEFDLPTGTSVTITLEGRYQKGKRSIDEYIAQTVMANPHATIIYNSPSGDRYEYQRQTHDLPFVPKEIQPHPYGVEMGLLFKMLKNTKNKHLGTFLKKEFSRVSPRVAKQICEKSNFKTNTRTARLALEDAEKIHKAINETKIMAPSTDCIGPIGKEKLQEGLKRVVDADFYAVSSRSPSVYRGNPFLVEAALAYGVKDGTNKHDANEDSLMQLKRIANRVPLLYQQSACAIHKAVMDVNWRNYSVSQSKGALPAGPIVLMVHVASVWVPFTSESKEAIAHYPEIIKEIQLAVQECGRKLGRYLRKQKRIQQEIKKRNYIETYLPHIGEALRDILTLKDKQVNEVVTKLEDVLEKTRKI